MRVAVKIELSDAGRQRLERLSRSRSAAVRLRERSRLVLMAAPRARGTQCRAANVGPVMLRYVPARALADPMSPLCVFRRCRSKPKQVHPSLTPCTVTPPRSS